MDKRQTNKNNVGSKKRSGIKGKGNRKYRDDRESRDKMGSKEVGHKFNDVSWYSKNEAMLRDSASFSYNSPLGDNVPWNRVVSIPSGAQVTVAPDPIPGLMHMRFIPTIGISDTTTSPANLAAQNIYSYVRYHNSGAKNYDAPDLMMYLLAMDSIYMVWNWAKRIYGYLNVYSQYNKYMPRILAAADNVNLANARENLADFRFNLNNLAAQISSFCVPAVMPLFIRHSWLTSNIYLDSDLNKAQMYMASPEIYYTYEEQESSQGGYLKANQLLATGKTYVQICGIIKTMIDKVAYSEDIGVMSGDILKAYGNDKLFKLSPVDADYTVLPVYNEEVLNQFHNSTTHRVSDFNSCNITQDPNNGFILQQPKLTQQPLFIQGAFINMPWNDVTPANTMVGTRLTSITKQGSDNSEIFTAVGSEFVEDMLIYGYNQNNGVTNRRVPPIIIFNEQGSADQHASQVLPLIGNLSNFDWHPLRLLYEYDNTAKYYYHRGQIGDISNYTIIDEYNLAQMHQAAILSEFNVPQLGSF